MANDRGIYQPEPWREQPPPRRYRLSRDPSARAGAGEMDWGPGLVPHRANGLPPSEGGMYLPKCPEVELRGMSLTPRKKRRPRDEVKGYPGERIG